MKLKTQSDCWKALLDGETLQWGTNGLEVKLEADGNMDSNHTFSCPSDWTIKDKFAELKQAHNDGAVIECDANTSDGWHTTTMPQWDKELHYRIKSEPKMYCRFKKLTPTSIVTFTTYTGVETRLYHSYKQAGWTECTHKTFSEIE
jgi:hypothetical protein